MGIIKLSFILLLVLSACTINSNKQKKKTIVCSTSIIQDCVQEIVGPEFSVKTLMGANVDPHSYNPRPSNIDELISANVIIYNGFHLEGKMPAVFEKLKSQHHVLAVSDYYPENIRIKVDQHAYDPHIWFHVTAWVKAMEKIKDQLIEIYPNHKKEFEENFSKWSKECLKTSDFWKRKLKEIPTKQRTLITSHDAFHYYGKEFGVNVKALQGISTVQEANPRDLARLIDFVYKNKINALFIESSVNPKTIQAVIRAVKAKGGSIKIGGMLYSDALGLKGSSADTYIKMINYNSRQLYKGLNEKNY
jgi:manganese/zinc/iron transport system substrate-binding protein